MNIRVNFSLILIILILINFKIILINEESLILVCFTTFCFLATSRLSTSVVSFFETQQQVIKAEFLSSATKLIEVTEQKKQSLQKTLGWSNVFLTLKTDFKTFNFHLLQQFEQFYLGRIQFQLNKKLEYSARIEAQLTKLFVLVVTEKVIKISKLQNFCTGILGISSFKTLKTIYFREYLQKI